MRQISRLTLGDVEYGRDLIEHCVFVIAVLVEGNRTQHAWHKGTAHDAGIFAERIGQLELVYARIIRGKAKLFDELRTDEGEIADFVKSLEERMRPTRSESCI